MDNKPTIKTKTRDPKSTDFSKQELVININEGSLFFKSNLGVHKLSSSGGTGTTGATGATGATGDTGPKGDQGDSYFNDIDNTTAATTSTSNITFNGNIGIGLDSSTTPTSKLQVEDGNILLSKSATGTQGLITSTESLVLTINEHTTQPTLDFAHIELLKNDFFQRAITKIGGNLELLSNRDSGNADTIGDGSLTTAGSATIGTSCNIGTTCDIGTNATIGSTLTVQDITCNAGLNFPNSIWPTQTITASDKRLKKNINSMESSLSKILSLRGVTFEWKDKKQKGIHSGFIAQELEKIIPEAVSTNKKGGILFGPKTTEEYKTISPTTLIPFLVEAIKEQQKQINELKEKLK